MTKSWHNTSKPQCSIDDCTTVVYAKTMCRKHYARVLSYGRLHKVNKKYDPNRMYTKYHKAEDLRRYHLISSYGISYEEYEILASNGCNICGKHDKENTLHVDHDHSCCDSKITCGNCVRGVVCGSCNSVLAAVDRGTLPSTHPLKNKAMEYINSYLFKKNNDII